MIGCVSCVIECVSSVIKRVSSVIDTRPRRRTGESFKPLPGVQLVEAQRERWRAKNRGEAQGENARERL